MVDAIKRIFTLRNILIAQAIVSGVGFFLLCAMVVLEKKLTPDAVSAVLMLAGINGVSAIGLWIIVWQK